MNILFQFHTVRKTANKKALLDSRATKNFLDENVWKQLQIRSFKLAKPLTLHNVDGTENGKGKIEAFCWLKIHHQGCMVRMKFYLTSLGEDRFILGYPFLYAINPNVDWQGEKLHRGPI